MPSRGSFPRRAGYKTQDKHITPACRSPLFTYAWTQQVSTCANRPSPGKGCDLKNHEPKLTSLLPKKPIPGVFCNNTKPTSTVIQAEFLCVPGWRVASSLAGSESAREPRHKHVCTPVRQHCAHAGSGDCHDRRMQSHTHTGSSPAGRGTCISQGNMTYTC